MSELGVEVIPYAIGWAILIFIIGSTWHIWMYLSEEDESHRQVHAKVLTWFGITAWWLFILLPPAFKLGVRDIDKYQFNWRDFIRRSHE